LQSLNPEQRSAVEYGIDGDAEPPPALLIAAGAGTGKTKALAHRVAHLILNGRDPQRLLLLTFTRRAAVEMTRRTQLILAEARGNANRDVGTLSSLLPWSGTFHAIGSRLLRLHAGSIGLDSTFTVLDRADSADLLNLVRSDLSSRGSILMSAMVMAREAIVFPNFEVKKSFGEGSLTKMGDSVSRSGVRESDIY
jgi:DNA helicase II / ATP-dependent DNA helicase PcrA